MGALGPAAPSGFRPVWPLRSVYAIEFRFVCVCSVGGVVRESIGHCEFSATHHRHMSVDAPDCVGNERPRDAKNASASSSSETSGKPRLPQPAESVAPASTSERFRAWLSKPAGMSSRLGFHTPLGQHIASGLERVVGVVARDAKHEKYDPEEYTREPIHDDSATCKELLLQEKDSRIAATGELLDSRRKAGSSTARDQPDQFAAADDNNDDAELLARCRYLASNLDGSRPEDVSQQVAHCARLFGLTSAEVEARVHDLRAANGAAVLRQEGKILNQHLVPSTASDQSVVHYQAQAADKSSSLVSRASASSVRRPVDVQEDEERLNGGAPAATSSDEHGDPHDGTEPSIDDLLEDMEAILKLGICEAEAAAVIEASDNRVHGLNAQAPSGRDRGTDGVESPDRQASEVEHHGDANDAETNNSTPNASGTQSSSNRRSRSPPPAHSPLDDADDSGSSGFTTVDSDSTEPADSMTPPHRSAKRS